MVTSIGPTPTTPRVALRLRMLDDAGGDRGPHGYWWPQSRDLPLELADLVDGMPPAWGNVLRAVYSPPDWDQRVRRVPVARGTIKTGCFPDDDTQRMQLLMWDHRLLSIVVIPAGSDADEAALTLSRGSGHDEARGGA
ncbi:DUF5994 family protein [Nocardioides sp.]|uniref:DUF5994 family protein n=1 Tax=Nocardioides sp. TaxID=35761 RepID=UPI0035130C97